MHSYIKPAADKRNGGEFNMNKDLIIERKNSAIALILEATKILIVGYLGLGLMIGFLIGGLI